MEGARAVLAEGGEVVGGAVAFVAVVHDGDGKADILVWRPSIGEWVVLRSEDVSYFSLSVALSTFVPTPGDYDCDGKTDAVIFSLRTRPGTSSNQPPGRSPGNLAPGATCPSRIF